MPRTLALAQLMALPYAPPQMVQLAAEAGVQAAGIRLWPTAPGTVWYPLVSDAALKRETLAALRDTGVRILDVEVARINERFDIRDWLPTFEVCAQLGAAHINIVADDPDESRLTAAYATACEAARPFGMSCDLEFMVWTAVKDLRQARRVVTAAAQPNSGIIIDALHLARSGVSLDELDDLPREWLHWMQLCDGPIPGPTTTEGLIHAARCERLLPGEGQLDLTGLLQRLPRDLTVSVEVPSDTRAPAVGYGAWARRAVAMTRDVLARASV